MLSRDIEHHLRQVRKILIREPEVPKRIFDPGVEPGRDQNQVRLELACHRKQIGFKGTDHLPTSSTRRKRSIHNRTRTLA